MELDKFFRDDPDNELAAGIDPDVKKFYAETERRFAGLEYPFLATQVYGKNPYRMPMVPFNQNESGNTKTEDVQGTKPKEHPRARRGTFLDSYGSFGGATRGVTDRYINAMATSDRVKLPLLAARIYNPPAVKQTLDPYDVALLTPNPQGMAARIYSNALKEPAKLEGERAFGDKFANWIKSGVFK